MGDKKWNKNNKIAIHKIKKYINYKCKDLMTRTLILHIYIEGSI